MPTVVGVRYAREIEVEIGIPGAGYMRCRVLSGARFGIKEIEPAIDRHAVGISERRRQFTDLDKRVHNGMIAEFRPGLAMSGQCVA